MKQILTSALLIVTALTLAVPTAAFASTSTDENGFTMGYSNGLAQGQIDHQAKIFHIGTICVGQTVAWCAGYTDGYLDGFFSTLPTNTVTHNTTTKIIVHEGHHQKGCHDNMTSCDNNKPVKKLPSCDTIVTGSCKDLGDIPSTPSTPDTNSSK